MTVRCRLAFIAFTATSAFVTAAVLADGAPGRSTAAVATGITNAFSRTDPLPRDLLADKIEVRHVPALPIDPEIVDKERFGIDDLSALKAAMKDFRQDVISSVVELNAFTVEVALTGTRASGEKYRSLLTLRFVVQDGLVTGMVAAQDPAERVKLQEIAIEGGYGAKPRD